ncbi:hypothetical protein ACOZ38_29205 [Sphaerisporangium viridialbum]|uniref:hypothetical protein n=1 Tax=Sphaerisporangium viridialbum TaxID=46189 RepID=UPI003C70CFE1
MSNPPAQPGTAERLKVLDRALARFSSDSLLKLLGAALDSPGCARFHDHLLLAGPACYAARAAWGRPPRLVTCPPC